MKKIIAVFLLILILFSYYLVNRKNATGKPVGNISISTKQSEKSITKESNLKYLFVPYWSLTGEIENDEYDELIYFGIAAGKNGVDKNETGFLNISKFLKFSKDYPKKFITVRMTDSDSNSFILKDKKLQNQIIDESIDIAEQNLFSGIVLDFEINGIPFDTFVKTISDFYSRFYQSAKRNNLKFYVTLYGDVFYRIRPYDVEFIAKNSDKMLVMAYDFHKAGGNPGPNFPFTDRKKYGYDFKKMINDYIEIVSKDKIIVVFGMFGYDWAVDEKNKSLRSATAFSLNKIKEKFYPSCNLNNCLIGRDEKVGETKIVYEDNNGEKHEVWFEDEKSVSIKRDYLEENDISQTGYWAYSYF